MVVGSKYRFSIKKTPFLRTWKENVSDAGRKAIAKLNFYSHGFDMQDMGKTLITDST
jgi:uncharacterized phage-associated protein